MAPPDQSDRGDSSEDGARAERRIQVPDPALPECQDVNRKHHEEDVHRAPDQELAHEHAHEQSQVRMLAQRAEPCKRL